MAFNDVYGVLASVRGRISDFQAILYTLNKYQDRFRHHPELLAAIERGDVSFVRKWFKIDLDDLSLSELRDEAQKAGIYPTYGKSKSELILNILDKQDV